ncbi:Fanconi anemia group J [Chionoecetes opilio]|uniref:DNA 5'-3' helicase n=1 Tax=Chionoecetes opilio TaxID=41210 RepID=A0A8J5CSZ8_CHIOP|nr:Fanconi anemia group J [Chionoecetes opilio]
MSALNGWIEENKDNLSDYTDYGSSGKIHTGTEIIAIFEDLGIRRDNFDGLVSVVDVEEQEDEKRLSSVPKTVLENLFLVLRFLFFENMKYKDDYRVALVKEMVKKKSGQKVDGWINRKSGMELEFSINFWCLNPAVAFSPISAVTHSIILTSGTLSPMSSFQSELGVAFKIHLEANHVIDKNQIFVGTVGQGPSGKPLLATYQHTSSWEFQDELGELVLNVCHTVPGGILCFLPSYAMLNKLLERWQNTGVWHEIGKVKEAMTEQKKGEDFERDMVHFYATIKNTQMEGAGVVGGVFFMAVFRGKVSEGLDFTDDNARAVISVGIPYPNVKNIQVDLKKKYNDSFQRSRKLLSGKEWYDIQAYRALNQALGRCIRHRYDWGALILVDMRFQRGSSAGGQQYNYYTRGLSKWVRNKVIHHRNFSTATKSLKEFVDNMMANPPKPPEMPSEVLPATSLESTSKEKIQSFASEKSDALHEVTDSIIQTTNTKVNSTLKSEMMSSQNISPCDRLQENIPEDQKECTSAAASSKDSPSNHDQSEPRHGSPSNESSKENDESKYSSSQATTNPLKKKR